MSDFDVASLMILALSAVWGFMSGFSRAVFGLAAWSGAIAVAASFWRVPLPYLLSDVSQPLAGMISVCSLFVLSLIAFSTIAGRIASAVRRSVLSGPDRAMGFAYGTLRGYLALILLYIALANVLDARRWATFTEPSRLAPLVRQGAEAAVAFLPQRLRPPLSPGMSGRADAPTPSE